jgi:hypothetical protein
MNAQRGEGEGSGDGSGAISTDQLFFTLSNERRRSVLEYLRERRERVQMRELVRAVAAREHGVDPDELTYDQRKSVYVSLRQTHLPKMDSLGIVRFDPDAGTIELVDGIGDFDFYYEPVRADDIDWGTFHVGLAGLLALTVGAATLGLFPFASLPGWVLPWLVVGVYAVAGGIQAYLTRRRELSTDVPWLGGLTGNGRRGRTAADTLDEPDEE